MMDSLGKGSVLPCGNAGGAPRTGIRDRSVVVLAMVSKIVNRKTKLEDIYPLDEIDSKRQNLSPRRHRFKRVYMGHNENSHSALLQSEGCKIFLTESFVANEKIRVFHVASFRW